MPDKLARVWDAPVRLVHWSFPILIAFSWWSAEEGRLDWHRLSGYALLGLVVFRLLWGIVGSSTARFSNFVRGPAAIRAYLAKGAPEPAGHNPLGGLAVVALLLVMLAQAALGLFAVDIDGIESGPLAVFVSFDQGRLAAAAHHLVFNVLLGLIVLHLAAIAFYAIFRRQNLVWPMLTGQRVLREAEPPVLASPWLACIVAVIVSCLVVAIAEAFWLF